MCLLATELAEKQLRDGTASSQVIVHYLKLCTQREKLERLKLERENELLAAKTKAVDSAAEEKAMYEAAVRAMCQYQGRDTSDDYTIDY